jgi:hypothetical protein
MHTAFGFVSHPSHPPDLITPKQAVVRNIKTFIILEVILNCSRSKELISKRSRKRSKR